MSEQHAMQSSPNPLVSVVMGSTSDIPVMDDTFNALDKFEVPFEARVLSAHRTPDESAEYFKGLQIRGIRVLIAGAGWAAHLAGAAAANVNIPVIGVPIDSSPLSGLDALLATVQMPPGVPVATVAIGKGGAYNAGILAVQILALFMPMLAEKFAASKKKMAADVMGAKNRNLQNHLHFRKQEA